MGQGNWTLTDYQGSLGSSTVEGTAAAPGSVQGPRYAEDSLGNKLGQWRTIRNEKNKLFLKLS